MKLDSALPWDTLFNRVMQSWRDTAHRESRWPYYEDVPMCESCASDRYVAVAMTHDPHAGEGWPHWMQHGLRELINELRTELLIHVIERPHGDGAVKDYFRGSGLIPKARQSATTRAAVQIVSEQDYVVPPDRESERRVA